MMTSFDVLEKLAVVPEADYHAASRKGTWLSSHLLADFRRCPEFYHRKVTVGVVEKPSRSYALGRAAHKLILEGEQAFREDYAVSDGPTNPKTGQPYGKLTKAYAEWEVALGKPVVTADERTWLGRLHGAVQAHEEARELFSTGVAERVCRANVEGVPCHIRMDWFNPGRGIVDLKTTADLDWFEHDVRRFGYVHQLAFYRMVLREATGVEAPVTLVAVEKEEPFRAGVWAIFPETLDTAERANRAAIRRLRDCRDAQRWPTGFETVRHITTL